MPELHDYSTPGNKSTAVRVVRPHDHVGRAFGGDRIKIDASELEHPAVRAATWTEEEEAKAIEERERRRAAMFRSEPSGAMKAADAALAAAVERRQRELEDSRKRMPEDAPLPKG